MTEIKPALRGFNPWWYGNYTVTYRPREIYAELQKFLPLRQAIALTGLRRVGKTTIMLKLVEDLIENGNDPKKIIYFSFDEFKDTAIREVIAAYEEMLEMKFGAEKSFLFLDEIQKVKDWENQTKAIYDLYGNSVKIILSGSESLFIRSRPKESLAGRIFTFTVKPLSFKEFLSFTGVSLKPVGLYESQIRKKFHEFTLTQGFPEIIGIADSAIIRKYLQEGIIEKVIYRDIPQLFAVKDVSAIYSLLSILMEEPGQLVELSSLASDLGISRQTLSQYLGYLEDSFLLQKLFNYSTNKRKTARKLKKYYPAIISPDLLSKEDTLAQSKALEWLMVTQLRAEFFWRDPFKNEVDIVLGGKKPTPIEVKFGKIEKEGIITFMDRFKVNKGFIVTEKQEGTIEAKGKKIKMVPAFKFLLGK